MWNGLEDKYCNLVDLKTVLLYNGVNLPPPLSGGVPLPPFSKFAFFLAFWKNKEIFEKWKKQTIKNQFSSDLWYKKVAPKKKQIKRSLSRPYLNFQVCILDFWWCIFTNQWAMYRYLKVTTPTIWDIWTYFRRPLPLNNPNARHRKSLAESHDQEN